MEQSVQEFWNTMEQQVGEKILTRSLGQYLSGHPDVKRERWGVFFLTGSSLYFKTFKETQGFLDSLIRRKKSDSEDTKELFFGIPFDTVKSANLPKKKNFWQKFITRPDERASLIYNDGISGEKEFSFTIATEQDTFFKILETLLP